MAGRINPRQKHGSIRASTLTVPTRVSQRLPHLTAHDVAEIDAEVRVSLVLSAGNIDYSCTSRMPPKKIKVA